MLQSSSLCLLLRDHVVEKGMVLLGKHPARKLDGPRLLERATCRWTRRASTPGGRPLKQADEDHASVRRCPAQRRGGPWGFALGLSRELLITAFTLAACEPLSARSKNPALASAPRQPGARWPAGIGLQPTTAAFRSLPGPRRSGSCSCAEGDGCCRRRRHPSLLASGAEGHSMPRASPPRQVAAASAFARAGDTWISEKKSRG
jgi:hypothetical protein